MKKTLKRAIYIFVIASCACLGCFFCFAISGHGCLGMCFFAVSAAAALYLAACCFGLRRFRQVLTIIIAVCVLAFIVVEIPIISASMPGSDVNSSYLIVLGAGVNGTEPSLSLKNRLDKAVEYLSGHPDTAVIVSGGQGPGEAITEAEAMAKYLTERGIAVSRIIQERDASSTLENLKYSFEIIENLGGDPNGSVIVSSEYHLYRAQYMAKCLGVEVYGVPAKTSYLTLKINYFIREAFAVAYTWVSGV